MTTTKTSVGEIMKNSKIDQKFTKSLLWKAMHYLNTFSLVIWFSESLYLSLSLSCFMTLEVIDNW